MTERPSILATYGLGDATSLSDTDLDLPLAVSLAIKVTCVPKRAINKSPRSAALAILIMLSLTGCAGVLYDGYRDPLKDGSQLEADSARLATEAYAPVEEALLAVQESTKREWVLKSQAEPPGNCLMKGGGNVEGRSVLGALYALPDEANQRQVIDLAEAELQRRGWSTEVIEVDSFGGPSVVATKGSGRVEVSSGVSMTMKGSAECERADD